MTIIEASSVRAQTMADDTLRLTVDIEPRFAHAAFELFGKRGVPMALAALKTVAQVAQDEKKADDKPKGGMWSQWLGMRCADPSFQRWLSDTHPKKWAMFVSSHDPDKAAHVVRMVCQVNSRAEIDNDEAALARFNERIRGPWQKHCIATRVTA